MALSRSQQRHYDHRCDIWRQGIAGVTRGANKAITGHSGWVRIAQDVPCRIDVGVPLTTASPVGRTDHDISMTFDHIYFGLGVDVTDADAALVTGPAGDPKVGECWRIEGEPQPQGAIGRRYQGRLACVCAKLPNAPEGIS